MSEIRGKIRLEEGALFGTSHHLRLRNCLHMAIGKHAVAGAVTFIIDILPVIRIKEIVSFIRCSVNRIAGPPLRIHEDDPPG